MGIYKSIQNSHAKSIENLRRCTKCGKYKDTSQFYRRGLNGLQYQCIECCKAHGRLRNGTTGIYRQESINIKNKEIMEDFTFYDFSTSVGKGRKLEENTFSINNKKGNRYVTFCKSKSIEIINGGYKYLRVREDNITGDLHFVFTKNIGLKFNYKDSATSVLIMNKQLVDFLLEKLSAKNEDRVVCRLSDNISRADDFLTYKIIK